MDIGGMDICDSDCQLIPHRHVADIEQFRYGYNIDTNIRLV